MGGRARPLESHPRQDTWAGDIPPPTVPTLQVPTLTRGISTRCEVAELAREGVPASWAGQLPQASTGAAVNPATLTSWEAAAPAEPFSSISTQKLCLYSGSKRKDFVGTAPRWWTLPQAGLAGPPRGRSRTRLSLGPHLAPRRLGEATPGRPVHRAPLGQSPPQCAWLGPSSGNVHLEKPEDAHRTFPHAGLGKLEGCGDVCPGLEALEK